jgi:hypothetical protein
MERHRAIRTRLHEQALGPNHRRVAEDLKQYAQFLRQTGRESEVTVLETRTQAIRAKSAQDVVPS